MVIGKTLRNGSERSVEERNIIKNEAEMKAMPDWIGEVNGIDA